VTGDRPPTEVFGTASVAQTVDLARGLAERFDVGDCIALVGELGAGKTVFVRGLAAGLGLADERLVSSPTFVLVQEYPGRMPIFHVDLYRTTAGDADLAELALDEMLSEGVVLIEWADKASALPRPYWRIAIEAVGVRSRRIELERIV